MSAEEREGTVPRAPAPVLGDQPILKAIWVEIRKQGKQLDQVMRALKGDPMDPDAPDGLIQTQKDHGRRITALEAEGEKKGEWWRTALWDSTKWAGAAGLGAWIGKGGPH